MKQEEKTLLLQDLCARLPYGVIIRQVGSKYDAHIVSLDIENEDIIIELHSLTKDRLKIDVEFIKPYLRPMSSMTDAEGEEYRHLLQSIWDKLKDWKCANLLDWLNSHHFDYRGLIPMGLALEALEGMYN